jgi:hypothetical protein
MEVHEVLARREELRAAPLTVPLPAASCVLVIVTGGDGEAHYQGAFPAAVAWALARLESPAAELVRRCVTGLLGECAGDDPPRRGRWGVQDGGVGCRIEWPVAPAR